LGAFIEGVALRIEILIALQLRSEREPERSLISIA
jgi:hypothetical protein